MKQSYSCRKFLCNDKNDKSAITASVDLYETGWGNASFTISDGEKSASFYGGVGHTELKGKDRFLEKLDTLIEELQKFRKAYKECC